MAGKKNKAEGKAQGRRGAGTLQSSGIDDITRRLTGMQVQDELTIQQVQCPQHVAIICTLQSSSPCKGPC